MASSNVQIGIANSVRAKLINAALADEFWYYTAEDSNFKMRRMLHTSLSTTPYKAWNGTEPTYDDMNIWGCHVLSIHLFCYNSCH